MLRRVLPLLFLAFIAVTPLRAHELPERVSVRMFAVVEADALDLMIRVPLEAMRDVDFPLTTEGYLVLAEAGDSLSDAAGLWVIDNLRLYEHGNSVDPLKRTVRVSLPGDRAFASAKAAATHFARGPLPESTQIFWRQAMLDIRLHYPLPATPNRGELSLDVALRALGVATRVELGVIEPGGRQYTLAFDGDTKGLALMPSAWRVASDFLHDGFLHILGGIDHLLFLLCLILPLRQLWPLVKTVTAFTVAHSITLGAAALGWVPSPLWFASAVEAMIALSIVYLAAENMLRQNFQHRWVPAFVFGLAHGFGFASVLRDSLQFAQGKIVVALGSFNLGVEAGQLLVLAIALPVLGFFYGRLSSERIATILISALVMHTGWHWMTDRLDALSGYFF